MKMSQYHYNACCVVFATTFVLLGCKGFDGTTVAIPRATLDSQAASLMLRETQFGTDQAGLGWLESDLGRPERSETHADLTYVRIFNQQCSVTSVATPKVCSLLDQENMAFSSEPTALGVVEVLANTPLGFDSIDLIGKTAKTAGRVQSIYCQHGGGNSCAVLLRFDTIVVRLIYRFSGQPDFALLDRLLEQIGKNWKP